MEVEVGVGVGVGVGEDEDVASAQAEALIATLAHRIKRFRMSAFRGKADIRKFKFS